MASLPGGSDEPGEAILATAAHVAILEDGTLARLPCVIPSRKHRTHGAPAGTSRDPIIVRRAQRGDEQAFALLADRVLDRFLAVAERILRDRQAAEDATQQALVNVWRFLPDLRDPARFEAWSYQLLVKACYSESRRRKRWKSDVPLQPTDGRAVPDSLLTLAERDRIERGLRRISVEHRTVLPLHYYLDLPLEQIATALDVPVGTVKSRIHRAHQTLRSALEADSRQASPSLSPAME